MLLKISFTQYYQDNITNNADSASIEDSDGESSSSEQLIYSLFDFFRTGFHLKYAKNLYSTQNNTPSQFSMEFVELLVAFTQISVEQVKYTFGI